jgi:hypothetical protein
MALLEGEAEMLTQRAIEAARDGDLSALKLLLDRIIPPRRRPLVQLDLSELDTFRDAAEAQRRVIQAALDGGLSLDEAERLAKLIDEHMQAWAISEIDWRADRYLLALLRLIQEQRDRGGKIAGQEVRGIDAPLKEPEIPQLPQDGSNALTLFLAVLSFYYDYKDHNFNVDRAWFPLPPSERQLLRDAGKYFPWFEPPG